MKLILEIGAANGSVEYAIDCVRAAAETGAWAVKGQMYRRDTLVTRTAATYAQDGLAVPALQWDDFANVIEYRDWRHVKDAADDLGVEFFASVFDFDAVDMCERMNVDYYKIASGDITFKQLLEEVAQTGKTIFLSTGAAYGTEYMQARRWINHTGVIPMVCTLAYPTPHREAHMARIRTLQQATSTWPTHGVGWSDHTYGIEALLMAQSMGCSHAEKHFTITPGLGGDHDFALTPDQVKLFTSGLYGVTAGMAAELMGTPELGPRDIEQRARVGARRSLCAKVDIVQGDVIGADKITFLRPGGGLEPARFGEVAGSFACRDFPAGTQIELGGD